MRNNESKHRNKFLIQGGGKICFSAESAAAPKFLVRDDFFKRATPGFEPETFLSMKGSRLVERPKRTLP